MKTSLPEAGRKTGVVSTRLLGNKYIVLICGLSLLFVSVGILYCQYLGGPVVGVTEEIDARWNSDRAGTDQAANDSGHVNALDGRMPSGGMDRDLISGAKRVIGILSLLLIFAILHDFCADIRQQRGHKCAKWLPVWFTGEPNYRKNASNDRANSEEHLISPNATREARAGES